MVFLSFLFMALLLPLLPSLTLAQDVDVCTAIALSTPTPPDVSCTCNAAENLMECVSTNQYCVELEEGAAVIQTMEEECAAELALQLTFGGSSTTQTTLLQQWSQLSQMTTCVQGYTKDGQPIVDRICYVLDICTSAGDSDSSICGCSVQYNQPTCQDCAPCPNGRGILIDCSNIDPDFVSIACIGSFRFASDWRTIEIRDDRDTADMLERYQDDWQDQTIDYLEGWQDSWGDLLPHTLFRTQQLCDALHDYTAPVTGTSGAVTIEVTCDCQNAVAESDNSYLVTCQSTQLCNESALCGTVKSTALIVDGEATTLQACADYDTVAYQQACLSVDICDVNGQHVFCNPVFSYGDTECMALLCNQDGTSLSFECGDSADVSFPTCQALDPDGLMRFIPVITSGGDSTGSGGNDTPVPAASSPSEATVTIVPTLQGTPHPTTIAPSVVGGEKPPLSVPAATTVSPTLSSKSPSNTPSFLRSLIPTIATTTTTTTNIPTSPSPNNGTPTLGPIPFVNNKTDQENDQDENDDDDEDSDDEDEDEEEDRRGGSAAAKARTTTGIIIVTASIIVTGGFVLQAMMAN